MFPVHCVLPLSWRVSLSFLPPMAQVQVSSSCHSRRLVNDREGHYTTRSSRVDGGLGGGIPETDISTTNVFLARTRIVDFMVVPLLATPNDRVKHRDHDLASSTLLLTVPTFVLIDFTPRNTLLHLDDFIEATHHLNADGSISVTGGVQRQKLLTFNSLVPAARFDRLPAVHPFLPRRRDTSSEQRLGGRLRRLSPETLRLPYGVDGA